MNLSYLDFEQPIAELQKKIDALRFAVDGSDVNIAEQIQKLELKVRQQTEQIFSSLSAWQIAQLARIRSGPTRWITSRPCSPTGKSCTATATTATIPPSSAALRGSISAPC